MTRYNSIELARKVTRVLHLKALQRIRNIPCDDCVTPEDCYEEGECAIETGEDE